jgi:hypothetical protein
MLFIKKDGGKKIKQLKHKFMVLFKLSSNYFILRKLFLII